MIEKNIFQSYYTKDLDPLLQKKIDFFKNLNPEYTYYLYNDNDMDNFVNENFKGEISECYNRLNIIVAKVDFWRYLILYKYGGVYLDIDSCIDLSLKTLIKDDDQAIITAESNPNLYVQWALIFSKEHPILEKTIELVCNNIKNNSYPNNILKMTGPHVYSSAINTIHNNLFNTIIEHKNIDKNTDVVFEKNSISYRLYGIEYNCHFCLKHEYSWLLYTSRKHWTQELKEKKLLKNDD